MPTGCSTFGLAMLFVFESHRLHLRRKDMSTARPVSLLELTCVGETTLLSEIQAELL